MIWMERNEAFFADNAFEKNKIAENFMTFVNLPQQMLAKPCSSLCVTQRHVILRNNADGHR